MVGEANTVIKDPCIKFGEITAPQTEVLISNKPKTAFISGQGGGKTFIMSFLSFLFVKYLPKVIGLIAANTYMQLSKATLLEIKRGWEFLGVHEFHEKGNRKGLFVSNRYPPEDWPTIHPKLDSPKGVIYWKNGAITFTASLDNYKAIEGQTLGWAILDETKDTKREAIEEVILGRLRQFGVFARSVSAAAKIISEGIANATQWFPFTDEPEGTTPVNPLYIFSSPTKESWLVDFLGLEPHRESIKESIYNPGDYFVNDDAGKVIIASTYHNEKNLPANYIRDRIASTPNDLINFLIYGDPFSKSGGEYVSGFEHSEHVVEGLGYTEGFPLHFTADFNTSPYMSGLVCQLVPQSGKWNGRTNWIDLNFIYEYSLEHPRNTAGHLGEAFRDDWGHLLDVGGFVYGDASGKNNIAVKDVESVFDDLLKPIEHLLFKDSLRIPSSNPRYKRLGKGMLGRRDFTNMLFEHKYPVRVQISPKCVNYIKDLEFCKEDANGKLDKSKNKDGIEERGHHLQAGEYLYCHIKALGYLATI